MIFKLVGIALTGIVAVTLLKSSKPEFSVFATIATGVVMVISMLGKWCLPSTLSWKKAA